MKNRSPLNEMLEAEPKPLETGARHLAPGPAFDGRRIALLVPCYNEAIAIANVVKNFRAVMPQLAIYVFDNASTDDTAKIAASEGAFVRTVSMKGKGHVVRRMFADVEADIYILVDGDDTYDAASAPALVNLLLRDHCDMVVGLREHTQAAAYRSGHVFGNRMLTGFLSWMFGRACNDILSGYRVFSRRFVKSFPVLSTGFEIETELTVHALELRVVIGEATTPYSERPVGSASKLNTYRDGTRILFTILKLFSAERPMLFYSVIATLLAMLSIVLMIPVAITYAKTGLVPRFPTAILSMGVMLLGALSFVAGMILDTVTRGRRELKMLHYLAQRAPE